MENQAESGAPAEAKLVLRLALVAFCSFFQFGYCLAYPNTAIEAFRHWWMHFLTSGDRNFAVHHLALNGSSNDVDAMLAINVSEHEHASSLQRRFSWQWSAFVSAFFLGFITGTMLAPAVTQTRGRLGGFRLAAYFGLAGSLCQATAVSLLPSRALLVAGRTLAAVGTGVQSVALACFVQECAKKEFRGRASVMQDTIVSLGCTIGAVAGTDYVLGTMPTCLVLLPVPVDLLLLVFTWFYLHETPKFLMLRANEKADDCDRATMASVKFYHGVDGDARAQAVVQCIEREESDAAKAASVLGIFTRRDAPLHSIFVCAVSFFVTASSGIVVICGYSTELFVAAGLGQRHAQLATASANAIRIIMNALAAWLVERSGRKPLLLAGGLASVCALCAFAVTIDLGAAGSGSGGASARIYAAVCIASVLAFMMAFSLGPGPIVWFVGGELVDQRWRAPTLAVGNMTGMLAQLVYGLVSLPLIVAIGALVLLPLCCAPCLLAMIYLYFKLPETKPRDVARSDIKLEQEMVALNGAV